MGKEKVKGKSIVVSIISTVLFILALCFFALVIACRIIYIESPITGLSMAPTLNEDNNEKAFINKFKSYERGDVVIVNTHEKDENGEEVYIIKRVIALAGDRVDLRYNNNNEVVVYLNGQELNEEYVEYKDVKSSFLPDEATTIISFRAYVNGTSGVDYNENGLLIKENEVFVMGDNRSVSLDSSKYGPFKTDDVIGRVDFVTKKEANGKFAAIKYLIYSLFKAQQKTGFTILNINSVLFLSKHKIP